MQLHTIRRFAEKHPSFTEPAMRNYVFRATPRRTSRGEVPGNGLLECGAIVRIGRKVLVNEEAFFSWVRDLNRGAR